MRDNHKLQVEIYLISLRYLFKRYYFLLAIFNKSPSPLRKTRTNRVMARIINTAVPPFATKLAKSEGKPELDEAKSNEDVE